MWMVTRHQELGVKSGICEPVYTAPMTSENEAVKDISAVFDHYRVSARAIWNNAFWPDADLRHWDFVEQFGEIQRILFSESVG